MRKVLVYLCCTYMEDTLCARHGVSIYYVLSCSTLSMSMFNGLQKYLEQHVLIVRNGGIFKNALGTHEFGTL